MQREIKNKIAKGRLILTMGMRFAYASVSENPERRKKVDNWTCPNSVQPRSEYPSKCVSRI